MLVKLVNCRLADCSGKCCLLLYTHIFCSGLCRFHVAVYSCEANFVHFEEGGFICSVKGGLATICEASCLGVICRLLFASRVCVYASALCDATKPSSFYSHC